MSARRVVIVLFILCLGSEASKRRSSRGLSEDVLLIRVLPRRGKGI